MAKRKHSQDQFPKKGPRQVDVRPFLVNAKDERERATLYANHAQLSITPNEIIVDLFVLAPIPGQAEKPEATLVQRVVIPHGLAKGLATALANLVAGYERETGKLIPFNRTPDPDDVIEIWEQKSDVSDNEQLDNV